MAGTLAFILVCVIDIIAFNLALAAEKHRQTATIEIDQNNGNQYCSYVSYNISSWLGITAIVFMLLTQAIVMVVSRCFCCGSAIPPGKYRSWTAICFFTCWIMFIIAEICLITTSVQNAYHPKYAYDNGGNLSCKELRKGVFSAAAAFIFLTGIFSELLIWFYSKAKEASSSNPTIGMTSF